MKRLIILAALAVCFWVPAGAKNKVNKVTQVTKAVTISADVDYHITSATPFTDAGSVDITNTEHAVVILDALRPTLAKAYLSHITINGVTAKDGTNCQLKMYDRGAIVMPYSSSFRPLTVYDDKAFQGNSYNNFTEGHNGDGFMKDVTSTWNNRIRSFKLKRGYMVTFALGNAGRGYSRCFIAADADLEMTLPELMDGRITSYRLFKWYDTSKVGLSDYLDADALHTLNAQTSFTWGPGKSMLPDVECVPHHIHEAWPAPADCGRADYSPHMKTNNEPRNPDEKDGTWTMEQILANWEALMATGMRLCTPSSWDGSDYWNATGFLADFLKEIDKRGWRCEIIDLHGYWPEGSFTTNVNNWAQTFHRPVWITEWVWGASWGNNDSAKGIFAGTNWDNPTDADLQKNKTVLSRILDNLNSNDACERYFYWNGERNVSKLFLNDNLTPAGEYFATMKTNGPGYTGYGDYVPSDPPVKAPSDLAATFTSSDMVCTLTWTSSNGDLSDNVQLQRRRDGGEWEVLAEWTGAETESTPAMSYKDLVLEPATYEYRVVEKSYKGETLTSNTVFNSLSASQGTADFQFGTITATPDEEAQIFFGQAFDDYPALIGGSPSFNNTGVGKSAKAMVNNYVNSRKVGDTYRYATYREHLWADVTAPKQETTTYIVGKPGNGLVGTLHYELGFVPKTDGDITYANARTISNKNGDIVEVKFKQPFESKPVVMLTPLSLTTNLQLTMWRIMDVTPEGFKLILMRQKGNTVTTNNNMRVCYLAMEQGQASDGNGHIYTVSEQEKTYITASNTFTFDYEATNPHYMAQVQTYNHEAAFAVRLNNVTSNSVVVYLQVDKTNTEKFFSQANPGTETVGFISISDDPDYVPNAIGVVSGGRAVASDIFTLTGIRMERPMRHGIYIVNGKKILVK